MDNEIDRKIDVTAILFLLVQNRQQTHDWTLIGSGANGLGIQEWKWCPSDQIRELICNHIEKFSSEGKISSHAQQESNT